MRPFVIFALVTLLYGCAGVVKTTPPATEKPFSVTVLSAGLPAEGLWRESFLLHDVNGDGWSDILLPAPRKAKADERRPYIFLFEKNEKRWLEGKYSFPLLEYDYGGISVGDINKDGLFDIALATHSGKIFLLMNNGDGSFRDVPFPLKEEFHSRELRIADINGDGWPDLVAMSEGPFVEKYTPKGLLVGINREGKDWETRLIDGSFEIYSDSLALTDINGDGRVDAVLAPLTTAKEYKKALWLGDGAGGFAHYPSEFMGEMFTDRVRAGDIDGDGRDELVYILSESAEKGGIYIKAYKWTPQGLADMSEGLQRIKKPLVFDIADTDGDGKREVILLSEEGLHVLKYQPSGWVELGRYPIPSKETLGAKDLRVAGQPDGSSLVVYSLGAENPERSKGLRAFLLNLKKEPSAR